MRGDETASAAAEAAKQHLNGLQLVGLVKVVREEEEERVSERLLLSAALPCLYCRLVTIAWPAKQGHLYVS